MSSGGRVGFDAPYSPRGCDMQWFSAVEVCNILSRFSRVIVAGDSLMRHLVGSINVLLREDLGYGAVTDWNFSDEERKQCFCNSQFNVKACSVQGIFSTGDVRAKDPTSLRCRLDVDVATALVLRHPIPPAELLAFRDMVPAARPDRPVAFVFGSGLWHDLDVAATCAWLDALREAAGAKAGWLLDRGKESWPALFVSPNAAGALKPDEFIVTQGNKALTLFEKSMAVEVQSRGVEHLGTWNMSIQATKFDGSHLDLKGNLVKAMMVLNWLAMVDVDGW